MAQPEFWQLLMVALVGVLALTSARPPGRVRAGARVTIRPDQQRTRTERSRG
jgi:hypothetical protein